MSPKNGKFLIFQESGIPAIYPDNYKNEILIKRVMNDIPQISELSVHIILIEIQYSGYHTQATEPDWLRSEEEMLWVNVGNVRE